MHSVRSICVFCGASDRIAKPYLDLAASVGRMFAANHITLVYGGSRIGMMGALADACLEDGGQVIGFMPEFLYESEGRHQSKHELSELHRVNSMHERMCQMFERADGFILLPGGLGSLDEALEIITWRQVGLHSKPFLVLNTDGYWDSFLKLLLPQMIQKGFVHESAMQLFQICKEPKDILSTLGRGYKPQTNFVSKWG